MLDQRLTEGFCIEIAIRPAKAWYLPDFAIYKVFASSQAIFFRKGGNCIAVNQLIEHLFNPALSNKCLHRQRRVLLADTIERSVHSLNQFGSADFLAAHNGNAIAACNTAKGVVIGHITARKSKGNQRQKGKCDAQTDF